LSYLTGIDHNIKQRIYDNDIKQSNYVINTSNILNIDYSNKFDNVSNYITEINILLDQKITSSSNILY